MTFDQIMEGIEITKYLKNTAEKEVGRKRYNRVNMLKTILFGFMDKGYISLRRIGGRMSCKYQIYVPDGMRNTVIQDIRKCDK